jgi:hypothetical protein
MKPLGNLEKESFGQFYLFVSNQKEVTPMALARELLAA